MSRVLVALILFPLSDLVGAPALAGTPAISPLAAAILSRDLTVSRVSKDCVWNRDMTDLYGRVKVEAASS